MSSEPGRQEIVFKSQLRLDIRRYLAVVVLLVTGYIFRVVFGISVPRRALGSLTLGLMLGFGAGYMLYNPYDLVELDVREFPERIGITFYPRHLRKPPDDASLVKTISRLGTDVLVVTDIPVEDKTELKTTVDGYKKLAKRYESALHRLRVLERELEIKAMEKARNVLRDYLEAREKLLQERKEGEQNE